MQPGSRNFNILEVFLWFVISAALTEAADNMKGNRTEPQTHIHHSPSLCAGEQQYVDKRKLIVLQTLRGFGINCTIDSVPHVALLASGGGQRSAVGLVGTLYQMEKEHLLDTLLYLGGVSGSTWSMTSVYSDPQWSNNMDTAVSRLSGPGVELSEALAWLNHRSKEEHFSLTDVWGVLTAAGIMKQMDLRNLSDEASRDATNPYPVYCAIEKTCFSNGPVQGKWFEVTPHEAGFTELGLFVETSLLGSKFENGQLLEQKPEMDMVRLQGVLGCALAHEETIKDYLPPWLQVLGQVDDAGKEYLRLYLALDALLGLVKGTVKDPGSLSYLDNLQKALEDKIRVESAWLESQTPEDRKSFSQQWSRELLAVVEAWKQSLEDGDFKTHITMVTEKVLPMIMKWEWGTTGNFLYKYQDPKVPACLQTAERLHLVDAGFLVNVAYPSFLGDKRDIDLIIAPEYSAGVMFETLTLARDYAAQLNKSFPEIDDKMLQERDWPRDIYVLEGKDNQMTVIFMPLFNRNNCKDAAEVKARMEEFSTFQRPFSQQKINFVLETAKANIKNNKQTIMTEVYKASVRRHSKR
ncbi:cytosolic phospholipase A2 gamma-like [Centropristis striata]|uniref:cytosolic phospholipase A2 gamma-like n=1 Tax=Centropristis striata TaxID=184440 RepID=UPI0027E0A636|nr:cytosolic phospholipase A2 gamma-like [Centropristis striata]